METSGESGRLRVGLVVAAVLFGLLALPMIRGQVFDHDDLSYYYLPLRAFFAECLATRQDPSWCPNLFGGFYLFGEGSGIAHPWVRLLYGTLAFRVAIDVEMLASFPALLLGFALLLRRWGVPRDAAMFGGLSFAFGGYNLLHYMHLNVMGMLAHLPWLLLAIDVTLRARDPRHASAARIAVSALTMSQLLLGHVQFAWISALGEVFYTAFLAWHVPGAARRLPGLAVSKGLGILGGSAQLAPLWDGFRQSRRERPSPTFVAMGSLPPLNLLQWVAPYLTVSRVVTPPMALDGGVLPPAPSMLDWRVHEFAVYYGAVVPALLAWLAIGRERLGPLRPLAVLATLLAVGSLVLSFGDYTPLFGLSRRLPVVGRFRIPARYLVLFHLAVSMLGAVAYATLRAASARGERPSWRGLWPLALPPALSVLACLAPRLPEGLWPPYLRGAYLAPTAWMLAGPALVGLATALVAFAARGSRLALLALPVFAAADQAAYGIQAMSLNPPRSLAAFLEERPVPAGSSGTRVRFGQLHETWHNPYTMKGLKLVQGYVSLMPRRTLKYDRPTTLRVAGVAWELPATDQRAEAWRPVPGPLARARLVSRTRRSEDPGRDLDAIDVESTALVAEDVPLLEGAPGEARLVGDRPGKLDVITEAPSRQLLVVSEGHHPGWDAKVDGRRSPVLRVNGDFLGCVVPAGKHHVQLRFRAASQVAGAWLSGLGVVLMTAVPLASLAKPSKASGGAAPRPKGLGRTRRGAEGDRDRAAGLEEGPSCASS